MRHKNKGRKLGRNPSHRTAMLRNLASSLFLSERDADVNEAGEFYRDYDTAAFGKNQPKVKGRVITTLQKAKQVRPLVEKCITIARKGLKAQEQAEQYATSAERNSGEWKTWRNSDQWRQWAQAMAPAVHARRRVVSMIRNKVAMEVLFDEIAPRFLDRNGGYTRIMRLASPRLGDAGTRAVLEFVGTHDRISEKSERPAFAEDEPASNPAEDSAPAESEEPSAGEDGDGAPEEEAKQENAKD